MHLQADLQEQIRKMKEQGIVEDCSSAWAFPLVIVKKKDGSNRICVDYRALNQVTVKDGHPLPWMMPWMLCAKPKYIRHLI